VRRRRRLERGPDRAGRAKELLADPVGPTDAVLVVQIVRGQRRDDRIEPRDRRAETGRMRVEQRAALRVDGVEEMVDRRYVAEECREIGVPRRELIGSSGAARIRLEDERLLLHVAVDRQPDRVGAGQRFGAG
jgi:hypothetical protein